MESTISNCFALVVLLTADCLEDKELVFAIHAASHHYKELSRIILVHDAESCSFPVPPSPLAACFSEKAITYLNCKYFIEFIIRLSQNGTSSDR